MYGCVLLIIFHLNICYKAKHPKQMMPPLRYNIMLAIVANMDENNRRYLCVTVAINCIAVNRDVIMLRYLKKKKHDFENISN